MTDAWLEAGLSPMASELQSSPILAINGDVRKMVESGREVCNLTIGDFNPKFFPVPEQLRDACIDALNERYTNYPPPNGLLELREAVGELYRSRAGFDVPAHRVTIASGARPLLYSAYRAVVGPGDKVVYGVPSWNNNHFVPMVGGVAVEIPLGVEDNFFPTTAHLAPHLHDARMLVINSPLNPTGTCIRPEVMRALCDQIVRENERRRGTAQRPLYLLYDQIYWMLTFGDVAHVHPLAIDPRMHDYAFLVDGASKNFAGTGMRVGWGVAPEHVSMAVNHVLGHVGAWAPHPMQRGATKLLRSMDLIEPYLKRIRDELRDRLAMIYDRLKPLERILDIQVLNPEGALYLAVRLGLQGCRYGDKTIRSTDDIRLFALDVSGMAIVPFDAFAATHAADWFRFAVGAVSREELGAVLDRFVVSLKALQPAA